jgi:hypothetical protein
MSKYMIQPLTLDIITKELTKEGLKLHGLGIVFYHNRADTPQEARATVYENIEDFSTIDGVTSITYRRGDGTAALVTTNCPFKLFSDLVPLVKS